MSKKLNPMKTAVHTFRAAQAKSDRSWGFRAQEESESVGSIYVYDAIGEWFGGITAKDVAKALAEFEGKKTLNVFINSPGGDVFEGAAIHTQLKRWGGDVVVSVDGLAASAASYVAMAGDRIRTAKNAMWMVHNVWGIVIGEASEMRKAAEDLEKMSGTLTKAYARRTGQSEAQIQSWMDAETWMDADEAKERGFTDEVFDGKDGEDEDEDEEVDAKAARASTPAAASVMARYSSAPEHLRPTLDDRIRSMEQRIMNLPSRASPRRSNSGQPDKR